MNNNIKDSNQKAQYKTIRENFILFKQEFNKDLLILQKILSQ